MQNRYSCKNRRKYNLKVHIILVTKYRKPCLQNGRDDFVKRAVSYLAKQNSWNIVAMETDRDHIHILMEYDTTERVCDIVYTLKKQTTYYMWLRYGSYLSAQYWGRNIFWSAGYFACSIGEISSATIEEYIANQG